MERVRDRVVIFDLEATCDQNNTKFPKEIIEIGAVDNKGNEFSSFVRPVIAPKLTEFCTKLTSIQQIDVDGAPYFEEIYPEFYEFFKNATLMSWGAYDKKQLLKDLDRHHMQLGMSEIKENHINLKEFFADKMGYWPRGMKTVMKQLNLPLTGIHHRGIDDARNIKKIYTYLVTK